MDNRMNILIALAVVVAMVLVAPAGAETVEVRGEVVDAAAQIAPFTWTARNFAGFYYDSDRDLMSEALTTEVAVPDTIDAGDLTYDAYRVKCSYTNPEIGDYFAIGWFGAKYMAVNGKPCVISPIILETDKDDRKTLATGQEWFLGNGYALIVRQIDLEGDKIWLELARDGVEVTSSIICLRNGGGYGDEFCNRMTISGFPGAYTAAVEDVGTTRTFVYRKDVGSENSVPVFSVYVDCIFRGTDANIVQLKHAILIDDDPIRLSGAEVGRLDVEAATAESVRLRNTQAISLEMDSDIHVAEGLWFHVADDLDEDLVENYRYYPYIEHACSSGPIPPPPPPPPPPVDVIFEGRLRVNHGIEIEDDVRVEVVRASTASGGSVTLHISSYQKDAVIVLSGGEPAVYRTISDEVIELEAVEVRNGSAWLVITGPADWDVTENYVVGDYGRVVPIRGEVVELAGAQTADIVWNASNSALFWCDLNYDLMTETLLIGPPCLSQYDRNIEAGCLHYFTSPVYKEYQVYEHKNLTVDNNTGYYLVGWMGDAYTAIGGNASKLCKPLTEFESDDKKTLVVGEEWNIDGGFALVVKQIDLDGGRAWLSLTKGGMEIDSAVVSCGEVYTYTADIGGEVNVPIFTCYVDAVVRGTDTHLVQVRHVFLIDDVVMEIEAGDRYGAMEVAIADAGGLSLSNTETSIYLDPGTRKHVMGNMYFETADDEAVVRFCPVAEYREPGVYEVRGTVEELTATNPTPDADMVWDYNTFAGLWYGLDDDLNTETLTINRSALNVETYDHELDGGTVTYRTHPVFQECDLKPGVGNDSGDYGYFIEGWMGDAYAAIGGDASKLCKLIVASGDEKMVLRSGEVWYMGQGFTLVADQINLNGTTANLTLAKHGRVIDSATVSEESVYTYTEDIGGAEDVLIFSCYVDAVFRGTNTELVQVTHVFLIDDVVREINLGDKYGEMEVVAASTDEIVLANTEPIDLYAGARARVMADMYFVTADDETVIRFCPVVERIIGGDESPADDCIVECEPEVNCSIEI